MFRQLTRSPQSQLKYVFLSRLCHASKPSRYLPLDLSFASSPSNPPAATTFSSFLLLMTCPKNVGNTIPYRCPPSKTVRILSKFNVLIFILCKITPGEEETYFARIREIIYITLNHTGDGLKAQITFLRRFGVLTSVSEFRVRSQLGY